MGYRDMSGLNRGLMQALQHYTPEYKKELLSRSERTWRPQEEQSGGDEIRIQEPVQDELQTGHSES